MISESDIFNLPSLELITCIISSGVLHSDVSCISGRIYCDIPSNLPKKVYHIVPDNFFQSTAHI